MGTASATSKKLTSSQKGDIAELAISAKFISLGISVSKPIGQERYDIIIDDYNNLSRVQIKTGIVENNCVKFRCCSRHGKSKTGSRNYTSNEIDYFAVYCHELDSCYLIPVDEATASRMALRLSPPKNNMKSVNWAYKYLL